MKWKTKNGELVEVYDMDTNHIENTIKMIEKKMEKAEDFVRSLRAELRYREKGKPVGKKPFATGVIESWEVPYNPESLL
jgi:hypothetical protein